MRIRILTIAAASVLALGAAACTQAEQNKAEANAEAAGDKAADVAAQTGQRIEAVSYTHLTLPTILLV